MSINDYTSLDPLHNYSVEGSDWLQHGEVLNLKVKCTGSPPFQMCINIMPGLYNITGNETCNVRWVTLETCNFPITHYEPAQTYTIVLLLRNQVSQMTKQVTVNFYQATKQSQLSVIVVPVAFTLAAVFLVVFGVASFVRFAVEVADFNFGETQSVDMEYKTFRERLYESVNNVIRRDPPNTAGGSSSSVVDSSLKYGSMT